MKRLLILLIAGSASLHALGAPLGLTFTYQGRLAEGGSPANGIYDFEMRLFDSATGGTAVWPANVLNDTSVSNGLFAVQLTFGPNSFMGEARWLEIAVRPGSDVGAYTTLTPRQPLTPAPNALFALNAKGVAWPNVTDVTVGAGMTLGGENIFGVNFGGSGTSNSVARSDHNHLGQTWSGSTSPGLAVDTSSGVNGAAALIGRITDTTPGFLSAAVRGANLGTNGLGFGVYGSHDGPGIGVYGTTVSGMGVFGWASGGQGENYGVQGQSAGSEGFGVFGHATGDTGLNYGVYGKTDSVRGHGVFGYAQAASGQNFGVKGLTESTNGIGVQGHANANVGPAYGVYGRSDSTNGAGVLGFGTGTGAAVRAAGSGIIESTASTYLFVPGGAFVLFDPNSNLDWARRPSGTGNFWAEGGSGERTIHYPITLPAVLYGQPVTIRSLTVYYYSSGTSFITRTAIYKHSTTTDTDVAIRIDDTDRNSTTHGASYTVLLAGNTGELSANDGIVNVVFTFNFANTSETVQISGLRFTLTHN